MKELIYERWSHVSQYFINEKISSMSERLDAVIIRDEKMIGN